MTIENRRSKIEHRPSVSVCIPSYNHASFLPETIESVLAQTFDDYEIVIVDDGSTDESLAVARGYESRYPDLIRVFTHPGGENRGISATVNRAFAESRGRYWSGLPSDDALLPHKLAAQVEYLERNPDAGWTYGYAACMDESGRRVPGLLGRDITRMPDPMASLIECNPVFGMTVLARREAVEDVGPHTEGLVYSDWEWWARMLAGWKAGFIPRPLVKYRLHSYNTSVGSGREKALQRTLEVMVALRANAASIGGALAPARTQAHLDLQAAFLLFSLGQGDKAAVWLSAAFNTDPGLGPDAEFLAAWLRRRRYELYKERALGEGPDIAPDAFTAWLQEHLPTAAPVAVKERLRQTGGELALRWSYACERLKEKGLRTAMAWQEYRLREPGTRTLLLETLLGNRLSRLAGWRRRLKPHTTSTQSPP